jgi:hypothetical protein
MVFFTGELYTPGEGLKTGNDYLTRFCDIPVNNRITSLTRRPLSDVQDVILSAPKNENRGARHRKSLREPVGTRLSRSAPRSHYISLFASVSHLHRWVRRYNGRSV